MSFGLDQILPSLQALGVLSYWLIGLASALEAFFLTGVVVPGTLIVDAGGVLVRSGVLDLFDLMWFVAVGSIIGGEISFRVGRVASGRLTGRFDPHRFPGFAKARTLFERRGALAIVLGRFTGPAAGFVPFVAALSGMDHRRFTFWNIVGAAPYAISHVLFGYLLGDAFGRLGGVSTRTLLLALAVAILFLLLWFVVARLRRGMPALIAMLGSGADYVSGLPAVRAWIADHPRLHGFARGRLSNDHFYGLPLTLLAVAFLYVAAVYADSVFDFLTAGSVVTLDERLAVLVHAFQSAPAIRLAIFLTALGDWRTVAILVVGAGAALVLLRRHALAAGLIAAVAGDVVTVSVLKRLFHRPRPELAYFVETSGSFPSGHAAISVAAWGFLVYALWRLRLLGALSASLLAASTAFAIGLSRIYLIEHYLSDVVNGWLVGAMWLLIGIAVAEWLGAGRKAGRIRTSGATGLAALIAAAAIGGAGWQVVRYDKARPEIVGAPVAQTIADPAEIFAARGAPGVVESILGDPEAPVNLILLARDAAAIDAALAEARWAKADAPTVSAILDAAWSGLSDSGAGRRLATPAFWQGQPQDIAFFEPGSSASPLEGRRLRIWRTSFLLPSGESVFVASASDETDVGLDLTREVRPDTDAVRDRLVSQLEKAGRGRLSGFVAISRPAGPSGDVRIGDGRAAVLTLSR